MKNILLILLVIVFHSCTEENVEFTTEDFGEFTIQMPDNWTYVPQQGIDSYVGKIVINHKEEIWFDLGYYSNSLQVDPSTHDISQTTIDNKAAKIVRPKNSGDGITGVYFASIAPDSDIAFNLYGTDLAPANQLLLLEAIETLQFSN